jgi:hypothetical protein
MWSLVPNDALAVSAHMDGLAFTRGLEQVVFFLSVVFAGATLLGLIRAGSDRSPRDRAFVTFCYVVVEALWFAVLYHAGSVGGFLQFSVAPGTDAVALSGPESLLLAIGTLTTAGAPGITPVNEPARISMIFELGILALLASWFIGVAETLGDLRRHWREER